MNTIVEHINSAGFSFIEFAVPMLVQSGVLIVILLLADLLLRKKVKAVFRYWIWMLVLLKLVLPTSLSSPLSLGYLFGDKLTYQDLVETTSSLELAEPVPAETLPGINPIYIQPNAYIPPTKPVTSVVEPVMAETVSPSATPVTPLSWQGVVFLVWLAVVIAMGLLLLQRALFVHGLVAQAKEAGRLMNDELAYCCASMKIKCRVGLKVSPNATTPSVCGLIRPVILVPWNLASTLGASRMRTVLMHELAHIRRADLWVNLAQTVLQIIYFYNPLLWIANCVIRRIREQAVDEAVLVAMGKAAQQYPQTLVDVAKMAFKRPALSLRLIGVVESKSALAGRIKHILGRPFPKTAKLGIIGLLAIIIAGAVLLPMAKARNEDRFSDKDLLIKFTEIPEEAAKKVSVDDTTIWSKSYDVEFAPGQDMLVAAEVYQAGKPMRILGRCILEGSQKPEKFTVTFVRTYQDVAKRSVTHNIQFKLGHQVFKIPEFPMHTPLYFSTEAWDWYRGEGLQRHETRHTKTKYAGIDTLFYYGASDSSEEFEEDEARFWIPGRDVTPIMSNHCIALKMIPLSSLKYLSVEPIGGYQGLDGKIISMSLTLEKADQIAEEYKQMITDSAEKQWTPEKQADMETDVQVEVEKTPQTVFTATLSNGVTVELVGVCEHPSEGKQWWGLDGQPIEKPYERLNYAERSGESKLYEVVYRLFGSEGIRSKIYSNSTITGHISLYPLSKKAENLNIRDAANAYGAILYVKPDAQSIRLEMGAGRDCDWKTLCTQPSPVDKSGTTGPGVVFQPAIEKDGKTYVTIAHQIKDGQIHIIAVDHSGQIHKSEGFLNTTSNELGSCQVRFNLPADQIKEIQFQTQKFQRVTFKNVSLRPGHKTDVPISARDLVAEIIESERKTVDIQLHMICTIPARNLTFYEYDWGYEAGKEFYSGTENIRDSLTNIYKAVKVTRTFDGQKEWSLRVSSEDKQPRGAIFKPSFSNFRAMMTFNTLLGFDAKEFSSLSFGEAIAQAESVSVRDEVEFIDGHPCYVIEAINIETDSAVNRLSYDIRAWIDYQRDYRLLKFEKCKSISGKNRFKVVSRRVDNIRLKQIDGIWLPVEGRRTTFSTNDNGPPKGMSLARFAALSAEEQERVGVFKLTPMSPTRRLEVDVESIRLNKGIPPERFTIAFPEGCEVYDGFTGNRYVVGEPSEREAALSDTEWIEQMVGLSVSELIDILRNSSLGKDKKKWFAAVHRLVEIGSAAVPEMVAELRRTEKPQTQSRLALTLRAIGDPNAVPGLIDGLGRSGFSSDYGIGEPRTELDMFIQQYQMDPTKKDLGLGRPVREITIALEKLTGHTEGHDHFHAYDLKYDRLGSYTITPEIRDRQRQHRRQVAERWRKWWQANKDNIKPTETLPKPPAESKPARSEKLEQMIMAAPEGSILTLAIVPNVDGSGRRPSLTKEEYQRYLDDLAQNGPFSGSIRGDSFQWSPVKGNPARFRDLPLSAYKERTYLLLCARAQYVMMPELEGKWAWGLEKVEATQDGDGKPTISIQFDEKGSELFYELTRANIGNHLAIGVDGWVLSAPTIETPLTKRAVIAGDFTEEQVRTFVEELRKGMTPVDQQTIKAMRLIAEAADKLNKQDVAKMGPRQVVENFLIAGLGGLNEKLRWFVCPGSAVDKILDGTDLSEELSDGHKIKVVNVYAGSKDAFAVTSDITDQYGEQLGKFMFYLSNESDNWLIYDLDAGQADKVRESLTEFLSTHPDVQAASLNVKISAEKPGDTYSATLPNGVTVELVGVCEHPSEGKQWWRPDGTLWEDRPYEEFSSHNSMSGEKGYELVWRLKSDEDVVYEVESAEQGGSAGQDVLHSERGLRTEFRNGEFYGVIFFFSPRLSQAAIGIGVGLDRNWKTIASLEGDVSKASSTINNVDLYPAVGADGRTYIDAAYRFPEGKGHAYRLVAVDTSNKQHIMQQGSETKGRGNIHCRKQIDLPLEQIKTIHFQTQPLQRVTFENVSLRPGVQTDVEIEGESENFFGVVGVQDGTLGKNTSAEAAFIIQKVLDRYAAIKTYSAIGELLTGVDHPPGAMGSIPGMTTEMLQQMGEQQLKSIFTIKMARPNLYCIEWNNNIDSDLSKVGNAWSVGDGSYGLILGKEKSFEKPLRALIWTASNMGKVQSSLFFDTSLNTLRELRDLSQQEDEQLEGVDCYVISGSRHRTTYTYWVSKKDFLIRRYKFVSGGDGKPIEGPGHELTDETIKESFKAMDKEATPEEIAKMRTMLTAANAMVSKVKVTNTETYRNIILDQSISEEQFVPSKDIDEITEELKNLRAKYIHRLKNISPTDPNLKTDVPVEGGSETKTRLISAKERAETDRWVSITGSVKNAGWYLFDPNAPLRLSELVTAAGYNAEEAGTTCLDIQRQLEKDGETAQVLMHRNLQAVLLGVESAPVLERHDAVMVYKIEPSLKKDRRFERKFSSIVELVVNCGRTKRDIFVDFDSGKLLSLPDDLDTQPKNVIVDWIRKSGVDAWGRMAPEVMGLVGYDMVALGVDNHYWDLAADTVADRLAIKSTDSPILVRVEAGLPATYLIKTREHGLGVLQILGFTKNPERVKIRYKMLEKAPSEETDAQLEVEQSSSESGGDRVVVVSEGKSTVYSSLKEAVDAAPAGSVIRVDAGVYGTVPGEVELVDTYADDPRAAVSSIVKQLKSVKYVHSGRGSAHVVEVRSSSSNQSSTRTERILDFRFEGDLSRSDAFTSEKVKRGDFECSWAIGPMSSVRYNSSYGIATVQARPFGQFYRKLGYDFHPETFPRMYQSSIVELLEGVVKQPQVTLKVTQESKDVVRIVSEHKNETSEEKFIMLLINGADGMRLSSWEFTAKDSTEDGTEARRSSLQLKWKKYAGVWYISEAISEGAGVHDVLRSEGRTTVTIREFTPNVEIEVKEFTLDGLDISPGAMVNDWILDTRYRYAGSKGESADKLRKLSRAAQMYANDYDNKFPDTMQQVKQFLDEKELKWLSENVCYLGKGKTVLDLPEIPLAYDKTILEAEQGKGTNVLFVSGIVSFRVREQLKKLGITAGAKTDVQGEDMKQRIARGPEQVQAIDKMLREWFGACVASDVELMKKVYSPDYQLVERDMQQTNELLGMNRGWQFSLLAVMWDEREAMAVSGALEHGAPKVGAPMVLVWTFKNSEDKWGIVDIDLEELEGLQIENSRFMQKHPNAQVWFDNPDLNAPKMRQRPDVPVDVEGAGEKVSRFIGADLPASVQNVKFHTGSFAESSRTLVRFDIPLSDLKNLLAKSDQLPDFPDLHKNPKIQKDMVEVHKLFNIEWWRPNELESPNCSAWIKSERAKGTPKVGVVNILNICCSQLKNNLMRVYIDFFSHAH